MSVAENLLRIKNNIPENVNLVAVTKTQPPEVIMEAYHAGHRIFGENKVQEMTEKQKLLPSDIEWHMIGHLQSNKVKYIAPFVKMVHSVDSMKLLRVINNEAEKCGRVISCLLQIWIASEETKFGLTEPEAVEILKSNDTSSFENITINGLMGMATYTDDEQTIRQEFRNLREIFNRIKREFFSPKPYFKELSMGMTNDYLIAIEEGATSIRLGSSIFGERIY